MNDFSEADGDESSVGMVVVCMLPNPVCFSLQAAADRRTSSVDRLVFSVDWVNFQPITLMTGPVVLGQPYLT